MFRRQLRTAAEILFQQTERRHTMVKVESTVFIKRPAKDIFDFLAEPTNFMKYVSGAISSEWTSKPPHGVGSTLVQDLKVLGQTLHANLEVTKYASPSELNFKTDGKPVSYELSHKLEALDGGTQLSLHLEGEGTGFFKLAEGALASQMQKQFDSDLQTLKSVLEK
jgi:hypothetical protein